MIESSLYNTTVMEVELQLSEILLGSQPLDPEVFSRFIASKNPDPDVRDELNAPEELEKTGTTVFYRNEHGQPVYRDYQIKGALKGLGEAVRKRIPDAAKKGWGSIRSKIDEHVFVHPRSILLTDSMGEPLDSELPQENVCERPLRAQTPLGPRVSLARSETVPAGTKITFQIRLYGSQVGPGKIEEILRCGEEMGLGQWRNSGHGRFTYKILSKTTTGKNGSEE